MIRATAGIWVSYASTMLFQVAFAVKYGAGRQASAFVLAYTLAVALSGVIISTSQSIVVPRLLTRFGLIVRSQIRLLVTLAFVGVVMFVLVAWFAPSIGHAVASRTALDTSHFPALLRLAAVFGIFQVLAGQLIASCIALGLRLVPAIAPALPTGVAAIGVGLADSSVESAFVLFSVGSAIELAVLAAVLLRHRREVTDESTEPMAGIAVATSLQFGLLALLPPVEILAASISTTAGAAEYNYAIRSLAIGQQLLVGGLVLASLGDWSTLLGGGKVQEFERKFATATISAFLLLVLAASIAFVSGRQLVALVYQHGIFDAADTRAVTRILLFALPGFCAEGLSMVIGQAILAFRRNRTSVVFGTSRVVLRLTAVIPFAILWGAPGVAAGYSVVSVVLLCAQAVYLGRMMLRGRASVGSIARPMAVAAGTVVCAAVCARAGTSISPLLRAVVVCGAFLTLAVALRANPRLLRWGK